MLLDYFILALKNVRKRGIRSWLTMLGVFIGIAAVVSLISLGQGLETAITGQFGALSIDTLLVQGADTGFSPPGSTSVRKMSADDLEIINSVNGIEITIPRLLRIARVEFNDVLGFAGVASMPDDRDQLDKIYDSFGIGVDQGRLLEPGDRGKIIIGNDFVSSNVYGRPIRLGDTLTINDDEYEIIGILERSSTFTLNGAVLMMEEDMRDTFDIPEEEIDFIVVVVDDPDEIERVGDEISRKLRRDRNQDLGQEDFEVQTPAQNLETVNTILSVIQIVVTGIALIALLVGGIGIANTMFTSVLERTKEIGVMKAIGAQNRDILFVFITEAALLGFVGGIVGATIGFLIAYGGAIGANAQLGNTIFLISPSMQVSLIGNPVPFWAFLTGAVLFSMCIGVLSGIVPAYQASKLKPVDAFRK